MHGAVHGGRRRLPARRRDREPRAADASVQRGETRVTMGGAPVYVWPGGGITVMVDVTRMPKDAFGYVPTPGNRGADRVHAAARALSRAGRAHGATSCPSTTSSATSRRRARIDAWHAPNPWPFDPGHRPAMTGAAMAAPIKPRQAPADPKPATIEAGPCRLAAAPRLGATAAIDRYRVEDQIGFLLRCVHQRATEISTARVRHAMTRRSSRCSPSSPISVRSRRTSSAGSRPWTPRRHRAWSGRLIARGFVVQSPAPEDARLVLLSLTTQRQGSRRRHEGGCDRSVARGRWSRSHPRKPRR